MKLNKGYEQATIEGTVRMDGSVDVSLSLSHLYKENKLEVCENKDLWKCCGRFSYRFLVNSNLVCSQMVDLQDLLQLRLKRAFAKNGISLEEIMNKYGNRYDGFEENGWHIAISEQERVIRLATDKAIEIFKEASEEFIAKGWMKI